MGFIFRILGGPYGHHRCFVIALCWGVVIVHVTCASSPLNQQLSVLFGTPGFLGFAPPLIAW
jgi:hypothetical protein